jgi:hypothetical protein
MSACCFASCWRARVSSLFGVARFREDTARLLPAHRTERIIFLADKAELPVGLVLPYRHFFALRQEDGTHRFFAGGEQ